MNRPTVLALLSLSLLLAALPSTLHKPGLPVTLKADEPAYYMMALSLAHDLDLEVTVEDVDRLFAEFPYRPVNNLIVMSSDGWQTVQVGKPFVYSLFAAPFALVAGANGLVLLNMLLLLAMVWLGTLYLARVNPAPVAALFCCGFFFVSAAWPYVFWLQPEVFNMAAVFGCLFCGLYPFSEAGPHWRRLDRLVAPALSGAALALAIYNKPMYAAVALPVLWRLAAGRRWRALAAWLAGAGITLALVAGIATALTGQPSAYLGAARQGVTVCRPGEMPQLPAASGAAATAAEEEPPTGAPAAAAPAATPAETAAEAAPAGSWSWLLRVPTIVWKELLENVGYFLWGRHTGLVPYLPFAVLAVALFLAYRRDAEGWWLLAGLALVALFFVVLIPYNWHGGGGFVGNRYYIGVYPAFLFLVGRIRPPWLPVAGFAVGGLLLASLVFSPFGLPVPAPTLQAHTRNAPLRYLPLEQSLKNVPGYVVTAYPGGVRLLGRRDRVLGRGSTLWIQGGGAAEIWISSPRPLVEPVFRLGSVTPGNRVTVELAGERRVEELGSAGPRGEGRRLRFSPRRPTRLRSQQARPVYAYRLVVTPESGRMRSWERIPPPPRCEGYGHNDRLEEVFFLGAELTYLGSAADLERDLYELSWLRVRSPREVTAGETFTVLVRLRNDSAASWDPSGAATVRLSYHWLDEAGETVVWNGRRTELGRRVPAGETVRAALEVEAPRQPGRYTLALDPVFEHVAWFSERNGGQVHEVTIEVVAGAGEQAEEAGEPIAGTGDAAPQM